MMQLTVGIFLTQTLAVSSVADSSPSLRGQHHYNPRQLIPHPSARSSPGNGRLSSYQGCLAYSKSELAKSWSFSGPAPSCSWVHPGGNTTGWSGGGGISEGSNISGAGVDTGSSSEGNNGGGSGISEGSNNSGGSSSDNSGGNAAGGCEGSSGSNNAGNHGNGGGNGEGNNSNDGTSPEGGNGEGSHGGHDETNGNGGNIGSDSGSGDTPSTEGSVGGGNNSGAGEDGIVVSNEDVSNGDSEYDAVADFDIEDVGTSLQSHLVKHGVVVVSNCIALSLKAVCHL
jgi:hypothetical protein